MFLGGLPFRVDDSTLKEAFQEFGEVSSAKVITDKFTGKSRGFGFVEMPNDEEAKKAMADLSGSEMDGRSIVVNVAEERKERTGGGGYKGGGGGGYRGGGNRGGGYDRSGDRGGNRY